MKKFFVLFALFAFIGSSAFSQTTAKKETVKKTQEAKASYVCPMHPEVTSTKPGTCPKCKMDLEKVVIKKTAKPAEEKKPAVKTADVYSCPMHPEVTASKAGTCPKCKMDLVKK